MRNSWLRKSLIVGTIIVLVGASVVSAFSRNVSIDSKPLNRGNTLYVGGSGPGNFSKIQDAINASSDGDTIYVYPGLYIELLVINQSISLFGANKNTTIIDGNNTYQKSTIKITKDTVSITNFTIQNGDNCGIIIYSSDNKIYKNIVINNSYVGIYLYRDSSNNWIYQNILKNNYNGIICHGKLNQCSQNIIENNEYWGILITGKSNLCSENSISNNDYGVYLSYAFNATIRRNNFVNNKIHVFFYVDYTTTLSNKWENNFYSPQKERYLKIILGHVQTRFYHWAGPSHGQYKVYIFRPGFNVDWHPAQEPYDIGG
ncbi:MAG: right-handed parallel beta-helix repeat-containing protein [Thermoplasmata archaeon]|nr:right-handed parallel beta-helix repeat-containing protein [Thermoplasmata archaeon]